MSITKAACLFPGQGSQRVGMGKELANLYPIIRRTYEEADDILGVPISKFSWEGPEEKLNDTVHTQPALFVNSIAIWRLMQNQFPQLSVLFVAGHSLGQISALVASESLSFSEGLTLVQRRGELMKRAGEINPGGMAAILGLDISKVEEICNEIQKETDFCVEIANDNCPGQVVISGQDQALEEAVSRAKQAGAKRAIKLAVSIAAHSSLMTPVIQEFSEAIKTRQFSKPKIPVIGNVTAQQLNEPSSIMDELEQQLTHRVRWTESIQHIIHAGINHFIEVGNGNVLCGLLRRIDRTTTCWTTSTPEELFKLKQEIQKAT